MSAWQTARPGTLPVDGEPMARGGSAPVEAAAGQQDQVDQRVAGRLGGGLGEAGVAPVSHDRLADLLWDGSPPAKWKGALAAVVSKVRTCLTEVGLDGSVVLASDGGAYEVRLPGDAWVDVEDAVRRLDRAEGSLRRGDQDAALLDATVASSVLCRPLLAGLWSDWVVDQRHRLDEARHHCSGVLARAWLDRGDPAQAVLHAEAMASVDLLREVGHRLLVEAEWARGDRGAALRALQRCEDVLADELGVRPSPDTLTLAATVRG